MTVCIQLLAACIQLLAAIRSQNMVVCATLDQLVPAGSQTLVVGVWLALVDQSFCACWQPNAGLLTAQISDLHPISGYQRAISGYQYPKYGYQTQTSQFGSNFFNKL